MLILLLGKCFSRAFWSIFFFFSIFYSVLSFLESFPYLMFVYVGVSSCSYTIYSYGPLLPMPTEKCHKCVVYKHDSLREWVCIFFFQFSLLFLYSHFTLSSSISWTMNNNTSSTFIWIQFTMHVSRWFWAHTQNNTLAVCLCDSSASHIVIVILLEWKFNIWVWLMYYYDLPVDLLFTVHCVQFFMYMSWPKTKIDKRHWKKVTKQF